VEALDDPSVTPIPSHSEPAASERPPHLSRTFLTISDLRLAFCAKKLHDMLEHGRLCLDF
jgi:hypothetical protein